MINDINKKKQMPSKVREMSRVFCLGLKRFMMLEIFVKIKVLGLDSSEKNGLKGDVWTYSQIELNYFLSLRTQFYTGKLYLAFI